MNKMEEKELIRFEKKLKNLTFEDMRDVKILGKLGDIYMFYLEIYLK